MIDAAYTAWRTDMLAGRATVLVADSNESVIALNTRARTDLILDGTVNARREVELHDGTRAASGDTVITRRNDRRLRAGRSWVRNGDRWTVTNVRDDGSLTLRRAGLKWGGSVVLPASYVAESLDLGYAVTSYRAQGITTDSAHVLVDQTMTRENLYVALTRGRESNIAYVATDRPDASHEGPHPADNAEATARSVLYGVLHHVGAELSAHETITAEHEQWGSIAQLAAEYETIAAAAQQDRWASLVRASGLTSEQAEDAITSESFGAFTAELRRAEANHHDLDILLPRLVRARGFTDADDIASILHHRIAAATLRPAGSGRTRKAPRLIAGLIPEAAGAMSAHMRQALAERRDLIVQRANAVLDTAIADLEPWLTGLGAAPSDSKKAAVWRNQARTVAAYRDRYVVNDAAPLGPDPTDDVQKIDADRARRALEQARQVSTGERVPQTYRRGPERQLPSLR